MHYNFHSPYHIIFYATVNIFYKYVYLLQGK